jgi:hydroxymethylpyrimidine pyrophosphatase-like HAD family hydrolase
VDLAGWLVITDLDGTLWDPSLRLYPGAREALAALRARGATVIAATGRRAHSALLGMRENDLVLPAVVCDGALGIDLAAGRTFHVANFTAADAALVLDLLLARGIEPCVNVVNPDYDVVIGGAPSTHPGHQAFIAPVARRVADLAAAVRSERVLSFIVCGREDALLLPGLEAVRAVADASVTEDLFYGGGTLNVRAPGVSKWTGVLAFCAERGLDPARTLAIGDGANDVEMLAAAAVSCTFAGASAAALEAAGQVLPAAAEGGWNAVVDLLAPDALPT